MRKNRLFQTLASLSTRQRWIALGVLTLVLRLLLSFTPGLVEAVYSTKIFAFVRIVFDYSIGLMPFAIGPVLILLILVLLLRRWWRNRRARKAAGIRRNWKQHLADAGLNVAAFVGGAFFLFNALWGLNYLRVPLEKNLGLELRSLDPEALCQELEWAGRHAEAARAGIPGATQDSLSATLLPDAVEDKVRAGLTGQLTQMGYPTPGRVRARTIPTGLLLRLGISGIYNPFTGEGNVAGANTPQRLPATMAHEMSHGYGFGDEGSCNFLAILGCANSPDPFLQYSGFLSYWSYLGVELIKLDPLYYQMLKQQLPPGIIADLRANYNNSRRYRSFISRIGNEVNNIFLKAQGVKEGVRSYSRVVILMEAYRRKFK